MVQSDFLWVCEIFWVRGLVGGGVLGSTVDRFGKIDTSDLKNLSSRFFKIFALRIMLTFDVISHRGKF